MQPRLSGTAVALMDDGESQIHERAHRPAEGLTGGSGLVEGEE